MRRSLAPLDAEQQARQRILIVMRWLLLAAIFVVVNYSPTTTGFDFVGLNVILVVATLINADLQWLMWRNRPIALGLTLFASAYDLVGLTLAIALVDGFDNPNFVLYYPALLAFTLVFPGRLSFSYVGAAMLAYGLIGVLTHSAFDADEPADVKGILVRLLTMIATVIIGNLVVRIDRERRARAVAAERAANAERERIQQEIHDGVSQNVYMLAMNLEALADLENRPEEKPRRADPLGAARLAKETLIETRGLLTSLQPVMLGDRRLADLLRTQAQEFSAVTGVPVSVTVDGEPRSLSPESIAQIYRVVQEGLANVYKHARATEATIALRWGPDAATLQIVDNGIGFDVHAPAGRGHGLTNMEERAARFGGRFSIESSNGNGTRLTVTIPSGEDADGSHPRTAGR